MKVQSETNEREGMSFAFLFLRPFAIPSGWRQVVLCQLNIPSQKSFSSVLSVSSVAKLPLKIGFFTE
jgi:hypothetical protein